MTRLGFIGVGKHAQKLAAVFRELGCDIVTHVRASSEPAPGFGEHDRLDLAERLVVCCPPKQALAYAQTVRMPMLVSKPLLATEPTGLEHVSVDLWRLWSPAWRAMKQAVAGRQIDSLRVVFTGNGPFRETHNGALDYGPHALAFVHDLLPDAVLRERQQVGVNWRVDWAGAVVAEFGNAASVPQMTVDMRIGSRCYRWQEANGMHAFFGPNGARGPLPRGGLREFCSAWLRNETASTLQLSCMGMRALSNLDRLA